MPQDTNQGSSLHFEPVFDCSQNLIQLLRKRRRRQGGSVAQLDADLELNRYFRLRLQVQQLRDDISTVHRFELAGLGKAPFHFTGAATEKTYCARPGAPVQPGSTCDYCGTCIRYEFWVRSADGREFKTGCDCIHKTGDAGLIQQISTAERKLRDAKNAAARARKADRLAERIEVARGMLPAIRSKLAEQPHPNSYYAAAGKSLLDYVTWCLDNRAGDKAASVIEQNL
jgi:hypothetical protein